MLTQSETDGSIAMQKKGAKDGNYDFPLLREVLTAPLTKIFKGDKGNNGKFINNKVDENI